MSKKLYVGNLPYSTSEAELRELFGQFGNVTSLSIITDRETGRAKGFAFVEMATDEAARQAITKLNGTSVGARPITVAEARPQAPRSEYGGGMRSSGGYRDGGYRDSGYRDGGSFGTRSSGRDGNFGSSRGGSRDRDRNRGY